MTYITGKRLLASTAVVLIIAIPLSVHAGFFAALAGMVAENSAAAAPEDAGSHNAQNVPLLRAALHVDPNPAKGGGDIVVSEDGALMAAGDLGDADSVNKYTANGEISVYIVREGDTLSQIAEMFGVSSNTILWANNIKKASLIKPGMTLVILPITGVRHIVKKGDTLASIAKKYEGDVEEIIAYNQLSGADDIAVNDTIVIPGGLVAVSAPVSSGTRTSGGSVAVATGSGSAGFTNPLPGAARTQGIHGYNGVDLAAGAGSPILSAADGVVIVAKDGGAWNGGYGNYIVVKHANGTQTLYAHLSAVNVAVGESVSAGEKIGVIGNTGRSTGTHLHFEVRGAKNPF